MSNAAHEAAAALAPAMAAELVEKIPVTGDDQLGSDLAVQSVVAAPETVPSSQPQTAPAAAQAPVAAPVEAEPVVEEEFDLEPVISDELQALLDEPDFDEEARAEVAQQMEDEGLEFSTDPEAATRMTALEKRNKWLEDRLVVSERKKWIAENLKAYPLLARFASDEVEAIDATSRRAFARQARSLNDRLAKMVKPALEEINEAKKLLKGEVIQEVRSEYQGAWGTITTGPSTVPQEQSAYDAEYAAAMKTGRLDKVIGVMMRAAGVNTNQ